MFLKKVYNHSKPLFLLMILFSAGQLFINYKRGVVCTPFFHFGMYSSVMPVNNSYVVWEIDVNHKKLNPANFSIQQWDKIILPIQYYADIPNSNMVFKTDANRILNKLGINPRMERFISTCNYYAFEAWYKTYLEEIINLKIGTLKIHRRTYRLNNLVLQPTSIDTTLAQLCN